MNRAWNGGLIVAASLALAGPAVGQTAATKGSPSTAKGAGAPETAAGVIVKVEPVGKGASPGTVPDRAGKDGTEMPRTVRLTINTAAVWRDWVRDQATLDPKSPRRAAADGNKSVATDGQPRSEDTLLVVDLAPETRVETRYRSATDEASQGAKTPGGAAKAEASTDPADTSKAESEPKRKGSSTKPGADALEEKMARFSVDDLKPGLYVEVDFRHVQATDRASIVRVMRPVGGPQTPAAAEPPRARDKD